MKKKLTLVVALVLILAISVGGTLAYLTYTTDAVTNTFTVGKVEIELVETKTDFKMIPGNKIDKDPKVTVDESSEDCWLFVEIDESDSFTYYVVNDEVTLTKPAEGTTYTEATKTFGNFITYTVADGWKALDATNYPGVYYREITEDSQKGQEISVLAGDEVSVVDEVTSEMMEAVEEGANVKLTFTAYAVQKDNVDTATAAWEILFPTDEG